MSGSFAVAQEMTEKDALERFERENAQVRALSARVRVVRAETRAWSLPPNPAVAYTREDTAAVRDDFLLVQQSVPLSGRLGLLRRAGSAAVMVAEAEADYELLRLRSDFRTAFYELLLAQERVALLEAWVGQLQEVVRILRVREREGEGSAFDRLRAERELADAEANLASTQVILAQARSRLASFFAPGTEPASLVANGEFTTGSPLPPVDELVMRALSVRADYLASQRQLEQFGYERRAAGRLRIPEPIVSAGFKRSTIPGRADNGFAFTVTVPIPFFNRGTADKQRARAAAQQTEANVAARRQQIETEVKAAYETVRLRRRIAEEYARELGDKGTELSRIGQVAYEEGEQGILELLDAYRVSLFSRLQQVELASSATQAEIELSRAVGEEALP
jgi:cobalt-zinc-cadmium efflux system outer membrane protein